MMKKIMIGCMILASLVTIGFIALIANITWEQYQDTKEWEDTTFGEELSKVPPFLARNYVKAEDKEAVLIWNETSQALSEIDEDKGIKTEKREEYEQILAQSKAEQEEYGLTEGEVPLLNERLSLYLELEDALAKAYESPETETLKELSTRLYNVNVQVQAPVHSVYFEQLRTVAKDYSDLAEFLSDMLPVLGERKDKVLTVSIDVGPKVTEQTVTALEEGNLRKFLFLEKLYKLLKGDTWEKILKRNEISRDYYTWMEAKEELESLSKEQYYSVSSITTYQQALDAGLSVRVEEQDGYTVDPNSPVESISYQGTVLNPDQYVRYGTEVTVEITEQYVEIPKPEEPEEPENGEDPDADVPEGTEENPSEETDEDETAQDGSSGSGSTGTETPQTPADGPDDGWTEEW